MADETFRPGVSTRGTVRVEGKERTFILYTPSGWTKAKKVPLVFVFHGGGGTNVGAERLYGMNAMADRFGFIVAYPNGLNRHWHDGRNHVNPEVDDVAFVAELINKLGTEYSIDRNRVFACGISNGGLFSNYLALKLSEQIKAIASVAGAIAQDASSLVPSRPVSVMLLHGVDDGFVPFNGGEVERKDIGGLGGAVLSHDQTLKKWLAFDGGGKMISRREIPPSGVSKIGFRSVSVETPVRITRYNTASGAIVESVVITNGGHTWPGHVTRALFGIDGVTPMNIDATEMICRFFQEVGSGQLRE